MKPALHRFHVTVDAFLWATDIDQALETVGEYFAEVAEVGDVGLTPTIFDEGSTVDIRPADADDATS